MLTCVCPMPSIKYSIGSSTVRRRSKKSLGFFAGRIQRYIFECAHQSVFARNAQNFFERRRSVEHSSTSVSANAGCHFSCMFFETLFTFSVMNHAAHMVVDCDEFIDAGST